MNFVVWGLLALLLVLNQWDPLGGDDTLVAGFLPMPLVFHAGISVAASIVWFLVTRWAWPLDAEVEDAVIDNAVIDEETRA